MPRPKKHVAPIPAPKVEAVVATPPPSPHVLALQAQVVALVEQRSAARQRLTETHAVYLMAQSKFQAAEAELNGIETEVQYRISTIAQLENRAPVPASAPLLQMPSSMTGVSSEPAPPQRTAYAVGSADDLRREMRGMM